MKAEEPEQYLMLRDGETCGAKFPFNDRRELWKLALISGVKEVPLIPLFYFEERLVLKLVELLIKKPRTNKKGKK